MFVCLRVSAADLATDCSSRHVMAARATFSLTPAPPCKVPSERTHSLNLSKRAVQVAPLHRISRVTLTPLQLDTHPVLLYFLDRGVELKFQAFFRHEKQACLHVYMLSILALAAIVCGTLLDSADDAIEAFVTWFSQLTNGAHVSASTSVFATVRRAAFISIDTIFYAAALATTGVVWYRGGEFQFPRGRVDAVQTVLLAFCHLVYVPVLVAVAANLSAHISLSKLLEQSPAVSDIVDAVGESHVDALVFFGMLVIVFCGLLLRLQFWYFCVLYAECMMLVCVLTARHLSSNAGDRASLFIILTGILSLVLWTTYDSERSWRSSFMSSCNLITENRRLSNQNIEMKEELSTSKAANPQLHYEMGDILRVLCQLKVKMPQTEKSDVDRIITALVTKQDLYEVRIDPAMAEYEEEVQGWLHIMASKQTVQRRFTLVNSSRHVSGGSLGRRISAPTEVLPVASSRRFSQHGKSEEQQVVSQAVAKLLEAQVTSKDSHISGWLFDKIRNEFFVDIFFIEERCPAPLQLVFVACVELNEFVQQLSLDINKVAEFAGAIENHYLKRNPYHNALYVVLNRHP